MFKFAARTILELGSELISSDVIAFYELIKNGFDAKTKKGVELHFHIVLTHSRYRALLRKIDAAELVHSSSSEKDSKASVYELRLEVSGALEPSSTASRQEKFRARLSDVTTHDELRRSLHRAYGYLNKITIIDTGTGMSLDTLTDVFLVIGTSSRSKAVQAAVASGEGSVPFLGEKGLGRLSAMRLGHRLQVKTSEQGDLNYSILDIDWSRFRDLDAEVSDIDISPEVGDPKDVPDSSGTSITIRDLVGSWTEARVKEMASYDFARLTDPFIQGKRPRIAIRWNGERVGIPRMDKDLLSLAHASVKADYIIDENGKPSLVCRYRARDLGFGHPIETDRIVLKDLDLFSALAVTPALEKEVFDTVGPFSVEAYWYNRRRMKGIDGLGDRRTLLALQQRWAGILLFRDRYRVFPYGEEDDDWLGLDRKALRRSGYTLNKTQFVGRVRISRALNPELLDQTNREGLRETEEQRLFLSALRFAVQDGLYAFMKSVEQQHKDVTPKIDIKSRSTSLKNRSTKALKELRQFVSSEHYPSLNRVNAIIDEYTELVEAARQRVDDAERESRVVIDLAGIGLLVESLAHELARASEGALNAIRHLDTDILPEGYSSHIETLEAEMKMLSKRLSILDPLSISGRNRPSSTNLVELVADFVSGHKLQLNGLGIDINFDDKTKPISVKVVQGYIVQILENLLSNSIYWVEQKMKGEGSFDPRIDITVYDNPPRILFSDSGPGILPENKEKVFDLFFSLKDNTRRRGLGLHIARDAARKLGGNLYIDDEAWNAAGRFNTFVLELPKD